MFCQQGYTSTQILAALLTLGVISSTSLPALQQIVSEADYHALARAKQALHSAIQVNATLAHGVGKTIEIDGETILTRNGYPRAYSENLRRLATLEGFDIDAEGDKARIWSPGRHFCLIYQEPAQDTNKTQYQLSAIYSATEKECV
ncbi:MAG: hypothetical protein OEZ43_19975 [Gammaproteobacteria bacterium]|nr:hypothetical protein [Gammaproteobacteria bacterium]